MIHILAMVLIGHLLALDSSADEHNVGVIDLSGYEVAAINPSDLVAALSLGTQSRGTEVQPNISPTVIVPVRFEPGSSAILPQGVQILEKVAAAIDSPVLGSFEFVIRIFVGNIEDAESISRISRERAVAVRAVLAVYGVSRDRVRVVSPEPSAATTVDGADLRQDAKDRIEIVNIGVPSP